MDRRLFLRALIALPAALVALPAKVAAIFAPKIPPAMSMSELERVNEELLELGLAEIQREHQSIAAETWREWLRSKSTPRS